jgi:hypothetical protein
MIGILESSRKSGEIAMRKILGGMHRGEHGISQNIDWPFYRTQEKNNGKVRPKTIYHRKKMKLDSTKM